MERGSQGDHVEVAIQTLLERLGQGISLTPAERARVDAATGKSSAGATNPSPYREDGGVDMGNGLVV